MDNIELKGKLEINKKNIWLGYNEEERKEINEFNELYKGFLEYAINEKRVVNLIEKVLKSRGYEDIKNLETLKEGSKVYFVNRGKSIYAAEIGKDLLKGMNIIGMHGDSPRLDLKQIPFYEDYDLGFAKTNIYGGIKKHQWVTIPLMLVGDVYKVNGEKIEVCIGEEETDPVFTITELLPHLASKQMQGNAKEFINPEQLNVLIAGTPIKDEKGSVKLNILKMLNEKYGIVEEDLGSAELMLVPQFKAKDVGLDRSFIGSYGQDDRSSVYTGFRAFLDTNLNEDRTKMLLVSDKEEVGSLGNTGMESKTFDYFVELILNKLGINYPGAILEVYNNSKMLSADVTAGIDPNYIDVHEVINDPVLNGGICITKYTGGLGKSNSSDANPKFIAEIRKIFKNANVKYQYAAFGKQGIGGGGTIAYILANKGVEVLDCGVCMLSMHSPFEVTSKADIYEQYKAYKAFYDAK